MTKLVEKTDVVLVVVIQKLFNSYQCPQAWSVFWQLVAGLQDVKPAPDLNPCPKANSAPCANLSHSDLLQLDDQFVATHNFWESKFSFGNTGVC